MPRRPLLSAIAILLLAACECDGPAAEPGPPPVRGRLLLVGIDSASWDLIEPEIRAGSMPHLRAIATRGVTAELESVEPVISPAVWTSVATGRSPDAHGVRTFYASHADIRTPTVWQRSVAAGRRIGLYDYLITWPPLEVDEGFVVPGWLRRDDRTSPPDAFQRAAADPYRYSLEGLRSADDILAAALEEPARKAATWRALASHYEPEVGAVTFYGLDAICHRFFHAFAATSDDRSVPDAHRRAIPDVLRALDAAVGGIAAELAPEDNLVIVSDHGAEEAPEPRRVWVTRLDELLRGEALPVGCEPISEWKEVVIRCGREDRDGGAARAWAALLGSVRVDGRAVFEVETVAVEGADRADAHVHARPIDAVLQSGIGTTVSVGQRTLFTRDAFHADLFSGRHHPIGLFLAAGGAFRQDDDRYALSVTDVTPLLYYLAGLPIPDDLEGELPMDLLREDYLAAYPPRTVPAASMPAARPVAVERAPSVATDRELEERLRSLGYVE